MKPRVDKGILVYFTAWCLVCGCKPCSMAYVTIIQSTNFEWYAGWDHYSPKSSQWFHNAFQAKNNYWLDFLMLQPQSFDLYATVIEEILSFSICKSLIACLNVTDTNWQNETKRVLTSYSVIFLMTDRHGISIILIRFINIYDRISNLSQQVMEL